MKWLLWAFVAAEEQDAEARRRASTDEEKRRVEHARRLLEQAMRQRRDDASPHVSRRVDKYFGTRLPPVCARLGCYVTDDGKRFYCVNPACQKHKKRETKHSRRRPGPRFQDKVYFRCPRCKGRQVDLNLVADTYICRSCHYSWKRND